MWKNIILNIMVKIWTIKFLIYIGSVIIYIIYILYNTNFLINHLIFISNIYIKKQIDNEYFSFFLCYESLHRWKYDKISRVANVHNSEIFFELFIEKDKKIKLLNNFRKNICLKTWFIILLERTSHNFKVFIDNYLQQVCKIKRKYMILCENYH